MKKRDGEKEIGGRRGPLKYFYYTKKELILFKFKYFYWVSEMVQLRKALTDRLFDPKVHMVEGGSCPCAPSRTHDKVVKTM